MGAGIEGRYRDLPPSPTSLSLHCTVERKLPAGCQVQRSVSSGLQSAEDETDRTGEIQKAAAVRASACWEVLILWYAHQNPDSERMYCV